MLDRSGWPVEECPPPSFPEDTTRETPGEGLGTHTHTHERHVRSRARLYVFTTTQKYCCKLNYTDIIEGENAGVIKCHAAQHVPCLQKAKTQKAIQAGRQQPKPVHPVCKMNIDGEKKEKDVERREREIERRRGEERRMQVKNF